MDNDKQTELGQTIAQRRQERGLSQYELAERTGIHRSLIGRIESGEIRRPDPAKLARLAAALDLSTELLHVLAGYQSANVWPTFPLYLRARYQHLPPEARDKIARYFERVEAQYGPADGEDERPED